MRDQSDDDLTKASPDDRSERISALVYEFLAVRARGEHQEVSTFCESYPELQPELQTSVESGLIQLRNAMDAARIEDDIARDPAASAASLETKTPRLIRIKGYRAVRIVSAGSQGTVYDAIQESTGKRVAIKVVQGFTRNSAARFEREATLLAKISHPGVANIIDRGRTADEAYFLVMDFVRGCDLTEWLNKVSADSNGQRQVVEMFVRIARAIAVAHRQGIVHRDLKPSNILVDEHGQPRIVDFGLAQLISDDRESSNRYVTVTGNIVGSIPWSSPEQASGQSSQILPATDVYAIGVLLYHALAGCFPYSVDGPLFLVTENICKTQPKRLRELPKLKFGPVDRGLDHIIAKCLSKSATDRFNSGAELADALDAYLRGTFRIPKERFTRRSLIATLVIAGCGIGLLSLDLKRPGSVSTVIPRPKFTNSIGMQFIQVPAGTFRMGSDVYEQGRDNSEQSHAVTIIKPFFIGQCEVTRGQYLRVTGSLPDGNPGLPSTLPVDQVSHDDALKFCEKLRSIDGKDYQLPTEAEWEYACRGNVWLPTTGQDINLAGWFKDNSGGRLHPVCLKQPNDWGIYDMRGNVAEWVRDSFVQFLGTENVSDPFHQNQTGLFVVRGGSAFDTAAGCRPAARKSLFGNDRNPGVGFRIMFR